MATSARLWWVVYLLIGMPVLLIGMPVVAAASQRGPGTLYREFAVHNGGNKNWRVTDEQAIVKFPRAGKFLPNPVLDIDVADLEHATRAEVLLDRWGGHPGTVNKRIRFNGNQWITIPEIQRVPRGIRAAQLMSQDNPVVAVPLECLEQGINTVEGDCDELDGFGWGQWGLYSVVLRIYYDAEQKNQSLGIEGRIREPGTGATLEENPNVRVEAHARNGVARIDVLAHYDGYDVDGDGVFRQWQRSRFQPIRGQPNNLRDHVGTLWRQPYTLSWKTQWVPDQPPRSVRLIARIQDARGYWLVTEEVKALTLKRNNHSVQLYRAHDVPEDFGVRAGKTLGCWFHIPNTHPLADATAAALHLRTWNGDDHAHDPIRLNDHSLLPSGKNHHYDYDLLPIPVESVRAGRNAFRIASQTKHHHLEVLWPGPALVVKYATPVETAHHEGPPKITEDQYEGREHFVIRTASATYWLDKNSGGLSRLIDRDGNDWIAFRMKPWGDYPAAAAGAFRGIPNLVPNGADEGMGHPGWDRAISSRVGERTIESRSQSGRWRLRWQFADNHATLSVIEADPDERYWFLYEGPIAGRWSPHTQYVATNLFSPRHEPHDFYKSDRLYEPWQWAYFGDRHVDRVLLIQHDQHDSLLDTFSHLGNTSDGLQASNGMVVFGFGRGRRGKQPLLTGQNSFRIQFVEMSGATAEQYEQIRRTIQE